MEVTLLLLMANNVWNAAMCGRFERSLIEQTIRAAYNHQPIPDEARPHDTLTNLYSEAHEICLLMNR
jgi:hypothetical protein